MNIQLPKLRKIGVDRPKKKKILIICDDIKFSSGIATAAKELMIGTCDKYDWIQIAAALKHPDHGKVHDLSQEVERETGFENVLIRQYCCDGYGSQDIIREVFHHEKPDALMIFTDPRFFQHVFQMEHEIRTIYKIPIIYWNIWDSNLFAFWNASAYASMDLLMSINRQTKIVNQEVLKYHETPTLDLDK